MKLMPLPSRQHRLLPLILLLACLFPALAWADLLGAESSSLVRDGIPNIPDQIVRSLEPYSSYHGSTLHGWALGGGLGEGLILKNRSSQGTSYRLLDKPGGRPRAIGEFPLTARASLVRPGSRLQTLLLVEDPDGSERVDFYLYDSTSKTKTRLSNERTKFAGACWSPDGKTIATSCNARNGVDFDLTLIDENGVRTRLWESQGMWMPNSWTPDGNFLVVTQPLSSEHQRLHLFDLKQKRMIPFDSEPERVWMGHPTFLDDAVLYLSDRGQEYRSLWRRELPSGKSTKLCRGELPGDMEYFVLSPDRKRAVIGLNANGYTYLYDWKLDSGMSQPCKMPLGQFDPPIFSPDGKKIAFTYHRVTGPPSICTYDLESQTFATWVKGQVLRDAKPLPQFPKLVKFPSFDGLEISAYVYLPKASFGKTPVLIDVHGGPVAQHKPYYNHTLSYLVNELGVAVIAPNVRGSSGYGKTFASLDNNDNRMNAVKDIGALLDWIAGRSEFDSSRVAIMGSSYGGFLCLNSLAEYPDRLIAGIDIAGVSEIGRKFPELADVVHDLRRPEYGNDAEPYVREALRRISPVHRAEKIRAPLLVIHGERDPRVPVAQADNIVKAVRDNGVECWYLRALNDGHGFQKAANVKAQRESLALFLHTYLIGREAKPTPQYSRNDHPMTRCRSR